MRVADGELEERPIWMISPYSSLARVNRKVVDKKMSIIILLFALHEVFRTVHYLQVCCQTMDSLHSPLDHEDDH